MIRTWVMLVAVAMVLVTPLDCVAQGTAPDPAAVEAYIETIESLHAEGVAIGDQIFEARETIDRAVRGKIEKDELARQLKPEFDRLRQAIEAHRVRIRAGLKPANTGDIMRNNILLSSLMVEVAVPDLLDPMVAAVEVLQASFTEGDGQRYLLAEVDALERKAAIYDVRYLFLSSRLNDFKRSDPMFGIHVAGMAVNGLGERNFKFLAESLRTGTFDLVAYTDTIEASLRLIEQGIASAEEAMANPSWLAAGSAGDATANARRRDKGLALAEKYSAEARSFVTAIRSSLEQLREKLDGKTQLSRSELLKPVIVTRMTVAHFLNETREMNPIRRELAKLSRTADPG